MVDRRVAWLAVLAIWGSSGPAMASAPGVLRLAVDGACPDEVALRLALREALQTTRIVSQTDKGTADVVLRVSDQGDAVVVHLGDRVHSLYTPARDCDDRADRIALYVALALDPPGGDQPAPGPATPVPAAPPPVATPRPEAEATPPAVEPRPLVIPSRAGASAARSLTQPGVSVAGPRPDLHVELTAMAAMALALSPATPSAGGGARLTIFRGPLGGTAGIVVYGPSTISFADVRVQVVRAAIDLGLQAAWRGRRFTVATELGAVLAPVKASGLNLQVNQASFGVDGGARLAVSVQMKATTWLLPMLMVDALWLPSASPVLLEAGTRLGSMPAWFVGTAIGVGLRIR